MKGKKAKKITLPSGSRFNTLSLDRKLSTYTITPDHCWNALFVEGKAYVEPGKSIVIGDTTITHKEDGTV